jgi:hypothetical protein
MAGGRMVYVKATRKVKATESGHWAEKKKHEALAFYVANGSLTETSKHCMVPYETLKKWKQSDWWKDRVRDIQNEEYDKLDARLSKALDKALDEVMDRLQNGEDIYDPKTGKIKKMPAKLRDVNHAFNSIMDKRQLVRKQPTKIVEQTNTAAQLQNLAEQFAKFVTGKSIETVKDIQEDFIEGDNVIQNEDGSWEIKDQDAIHDERKEGL